MSRLRLPAVYQVEYSRNLLFKVGGQLDRVVNTWSTGGIDLNKPRITSGQPARRTGDESRPGPDRASRQHRGPAPGASMGCSTAR
jgi:hypothetical protein